MDILSKKFKEQNEEIIGNINSLIKETSYDGRANIKVRFRKVQDSKNTYVIEVQTNSKKIFSSISLTTNPFNSFWLLYSVPQIKKKTGLLHCKKSKYGGYSFF